MFTLPALSQFFQQVLIQSVILASVISQWIYCWFNCNNGEKRNRLNNLWRNISLGIPHQKMPPILELNSVVYTSHALDKWRQRLEFKYIIGWQFRICELSADCNLKKKSGNFTFCNPFCLMAKSNKRPTGSASCVSGKTCSEPSKDD